MYGKDGRFRRTSDKHTDRQRKQKDKETDRGAQRWTNMRQTRQRHRNRETDTWREIPSSWPLRSSIIINTKRRKK